MRPLFGIGLLCVAVGCGAGLNESRQRAIEVGLAEDARSAAEITAETMRQSRLQSLQNECLAAFDCTLRREKIDSLMRGLHAACHNEYARHQRCQAEQAKKEGEGTLAGCIFGT